MTARKIDSPDGLLDLVLPTSTATERLGRAIGRMLTGGEILALTGELGTGKTTLVRGIAGGLRAPTASVSSPTFVLIHEYRGRLPLIHADLYRLRTEAEVGSIGLEDYFTDQTVVAIEWADRFPDLLPRDRLEIDLSHRSPTGRTVRLRAQGPRSVALLSRVRPASLSAQRSPSPRRTSADRRRKALNR